MRSRLQILGAILLLGISAPASARRGGQLRHTHLQPQPSRHHASTARHRAMRVATAAHGPRLQPSASQGPPACDGLQGREIAIETSRPAHLGLKTYPETLELHDHEVVLTFDDGPTPATTPVVLDALRHECVKATFFLIGRNAAAHPALVQRELAEGHSLGHHSMTHPSVTLRSLDDRSSEREIDDGISADEKAAYGDGKSEAPRVRFFRFPGFADSKHLLDYLDGKHIAVFGTDLWAADWLPMTPDFERERVMDLLERSPRHAGIILFHDTRTSTAQMLPALLRDLRAKGYKVAHLVPAKPGDAPMQRLAAPDGWSSETEAIIAHVWPRIEPGASHRLLGRRGARSRDAERLHRGGRHARTAARSWARRT